MDMLERLLEHYRSHDGVRFATVGQVADEFRAEHAAGATAETRSGATAG